MDAGKLRQVKYRKMSAVKVTFDLCTIGDCLFTGYPLGPMCSLGVESFHAFIFANVR